MAVARPQKYMMQVDGRIYVGQLVGRVESACGYPSRSEVAWGFRDIVVQVPCIKEIHLLAGSSGVKRHGRRSSRLASSTQKSVFSTVDVMCPAAYDTRCSASVNSAQVQR